VGTTKLTRKEILGDDPVFDALVASIEKVRENARLIGIAAACVVLVGLGAYFGLQLLDRREMEAQRQLTKAMEFYHGSIDAGALDDPYGKGADPSFRTEEARYRSAAREFQTTIDQHGSSKLAVVARYYLGLCQLQLGQKSDALKSLETVRDNNKDRTLSYLAKKVLAKTYLDSDNAKGCQEILEGMIKDPQCDLPKEDLKLQLARCFTAQGKRDDALRVLREARTEAGRSSLQALIGQELSRVEASGSGVAPHPSPAPAPRP
jgi:predicted negative regulator of RcsB-dependent stress response